MKYYERIKAAREDRDITQQEIAKVLHTTQAQIWKYETGKQEMTAERLKTLCQYLNVSADYILGLPKGLEWPR